MPVEIHEGFLEYPAVAARLREGRSHLLLGNGFSIACDPVFTYTSLYDAAVSAGLSERAQAIFARLGTNNFEGAMRLLDDGHFVAQTYGLLSGPSSGMLDDLEVIKRALVAAVARSHLAHTGEVADERKERAASFLTPYHNLFTTNYDLLVYWVNMAAGSPPPYEDGFRGDEEDRDATSVVFSEHLGDKRGIYFLHGALHLYISGGQLRKHSWTRTGRRLTNLIRGGLDEGHYPLFVAEGSAERKLEQIRRSAYLSYCLSKLGRIQNRLVVFGNSLGANDAHILDAIARNDKLKELYVGLYRDFESPASALTKQATRQLAIDWGARNAGGRRLPTLNVYFYDSSTAVCWD